MLLTLSIVFVNFVSVIGRHKILPVSRLQYFEDTKFVRKRCLHKVPLPDYKTSKRSTASLQNFTVSNEANQILGDKKYPCKSLKKASF